MNEYRWVSLVEMKEELVLMTAVKPNRYPREKDMECKKTQALVKLARVVASENVLCSLSI